MKTLRRTLLTALLALSASLAMAADVTGKWTGEAEGPNGSFTLKFDFKQSGDKLTGSMEGPQGEPMTINDGKVDGDNVSFSITFEGGGNQMKIIHSGAVKGDEMTLNVKFDGGPGGEGPGPVTLKRVK